MADALCGPSNALQNFQKHSTVDRTLQQDRLTTRHPLSQGFRSSPGSSIGLLDPEFEAFQADQVPLPYPEAQQFHPPGFPSSYAPLQLNQPSSAAWASDFQNPSIASPSPQYQPHTYTQQPQPRQLGSGWQNDFAKQQSQPAGPASSNYAGYGSIPFQRLSTMAPMAPLQAQSYTMAASQGQIDQRQAQNTEAFDEEAFARAFDQAAQLELAMEQAQQQSLGVDQDVLVDESAERLMGSDQMLEPQRLGADLIHDPREGERVQTQDDPDALARTAGQLLDSVRDNQSDKFQKSQFLELMRQLRDREVTVEGDKIVGVPSEDSKDALEKSLLSIARQLSLLDFARVEPLLASLRTARPSVPDQVTIGAFIRTLTHISAALDRLLTTHPDLVQRAKPFGMSIGVEVFALAHNPLLLDRFPALKTLVLSFTSQFSELGIDPRMVRRAHEPRSSLSSSSSSFSPAPASASASASAAVSGGNTSPEAQLRSWLDDWLAGINARRRQRQGGGGAQWLLSAQQIGALLGPDIYPYPSAGADTGGEEPRAPTQHDLDRMTEMLGPHILHAMQQIWTSPHTRLFVNPPVAQWDDFVAYADGLRDLQEAEAEAEAEAGGAGELELEHQLELETLFPSGPQVVVG